MWRSRPVAAAATLIICLAAASVAAADPTPFATTSVNCAGPGGTTFPVQSTEHPAVIYSLTSSGASGEVYSDGGEFSAGDEIWGQAGAVSAGTAPTLNVGCFSSGMAQVSLYDLPNAPTSITGVSSNPNSSANLLFKALGAGQYVLNVTIDQGAVEIYNPGTTGNFTVNSSGQYPLGSLIAGPNGIGIQGLSGPTAHYTMSVSEVPVALSSLTFGSTRYAGAGTILTGSFTASGDTTVNAYVHNSAGQVVRHLGSFSVQQGDSSLTWDVRGDGGATLPDGVYYLHLDSTDPNRHVTSAETSIILDDTPPTAGMISPSTISPTQALSFAVGDAESGVQNMSLSVDGADVEDFGGYTGNPVPSTFSYGGGNSDYGESWTLGRHTWEIQATDNAGNQADQAGTFTVANPPPSPTKSSGSKPVPTLTGARATAALGRWLRARYGSALKQYWACPQAQIFSKQASCVAEVHAAGRWHLVWATAKYSGSTLTISHAHTSSWRRKWSKYGHKYVAGFGARGRAQVNSPAFDWSFMTGGAYSQYRHHRRRFVVDSYDGPGAGYGRVVDFSCQTHGKLIVCTNAFGDAMRYRP